MYEYGDTVPREYQIRCSGKIATMESIAQSDGMNSAPNSHFRFCIFGFHPRHQPRSSFRSETVHNVYSAAAGTIISFPSFWPIILNIARAMMGDTLFPIILNECQIVGWKR